MERTQKEDKCMWSRQELKMRGKMAFQRNYASAVAVALLMGIISLLFGSGNNSSGAQNIQSGEYGNAVMDGVSRITDLPNFSLIAGMVGILGILSALAVFLLKIFVEAVLEVGGYRFFILNQTERPKMSVMLDPFHSGHYGNVVGTMFVMRLFIGLWSLLLIVPGIIKAYEYLMVPYILAENPGMDRREAFQISKQMMDGNKMDAFVMDLSFFGWHFLSIFTCGLLSIFYVDPYRQATFAELYAVNKESAYEAGYIR